MRVSLRAAYKWLDGSAARELLVWPLAAPVQSGVQTLRPSRWYAGGGTPTRVTDLPKDRRVFETRAFRPIARIVRLPV